jgi:hypothetical protein
MNALYLCVVAHNKMKITSCIVLIFILNGCVSPIGTYHFKEGIEFGTGAKMKLKWNKKFKLTWRVGLIKGETVGKWEKVGDTLIFNSGHQPDSLILQKKYRYLTDQKWLLENDKLYELKMENGIYIKTNCYE